MELSYTWAARQQRPSHATTVLFLEPGFCFYPGFINGYTQPVAKIVLRLSNITAKQVHHLKQGLQAYFPEFIFSSQLSQVTELMQCFAQLICQLQQAGNVPIFSEPKIIPLPTKQRFLLWLPSLFPVCFYPSLNTTLKVLNHCFSYQKKEDNIIQELNQLILHLKKHSPQGSNSLKFLKAANMAQIPWTHFVTNTFQYGYGINSCWLDSTFTHNTRYIPAALATDKSRIAFALHKAGFPVAPSFVVQNELDVIQNAAKLGYPLVIKPADGSGGIAVYPNLINEFELRQAFQQAKPYSKTLLLEKHIIGRDYRLLVFQGRLIWAIERIPATILGDGLHTVSKLIEQCNQQRRTAKLLGTIAITSALESILEQQGLTLTSIPKKGQAILLSYLANISQGGTPIAVLDKVHPANKLLAESIANFLRLDLIGIDFISPNITQPYFSNAGTIIEVNAQPQLGSITSSHLYTELLNTLAPNKGRIPIIVLYAEQHCFSDLIKPLASILNTYFSSYGIALNNAVYINGQQCLTTSSLFAAGQHLLMRQDIAALIYCISTPGEALTQGLPFDQYNHLIFCQQSNKQQHPSNDDYTLFINTLIEACQQKLIFTEPAFKQHQNWLQNKSNLSLSVITFSNEPSDEQATLLDIIRQLINGSKK